MTSKNRQPVECVQELPACCPSCHCTDREQVNGVTFKEREIPGKTRDGRVFSKVQWCYTKCKNCGQNYKFIRYLHPAVRTSGDKSLIGSKPKPPSGHGKLRTKSADHGQG